jgi:hypothetical protein
MHGDTDPPVVGSMVIETELVRDPEGDEEGDRHAGRQAGNIDKRMHPVFLKIAYGNGEEISEHAFDFGIRQKDPPKGYHFYYAVIISDL